MTASPISDLNPVLMASGSKLTLVSNGKLHLLVALRGVEESIVLCHGSVINRLGQHLEVEVNIM